MNSRPPLLHCVRAAALSAEFKKQLADEEAKIQKLVEKLSKSKNTKSILEDMKKDLEHAKASAAEQLRKAEERETHMREASRRELQLMGEKLKRGEDEVAAMSRRAKEQEERLKDVSARMERGQKEYERMKEKAEELRKASSSRERGPNSRRGKLDG